MNKRDKTFIFPKLFADKVAEDGISKRELFAAMAMQMWGVRSDHWHTEEPEYVARKAVEFADALLEKLGEK